MQLSESFENGGDCVLADCRVIERWTQRIWLEDGHSSDPAKDHVRNYAVDLERFGNLDGVFGIALNDGKMLANQVCRNLLFFKHIGQL